MDRTIEALFAAAPSPERDRRDWMDGITRQRVRTTHAGDVLYVDSYPVYTSAMMRQARELAAKRGPMQETREAQRRVNARHARRTLAALANANFGPGDVLATLTYRPEDPTRPMDARAAKKDMDRYIRRVREWRKKHGLGPMRYIYVIETTNGPKWGRQYHAHLLTGGDMTELDLRRLWRELHKDARVQTDLVWDRPEGLTDWAGYVTKGDDPDADGRQRVETAKRWYASRGLKRPTVTVADHKLSRTRAEKIARDMDDDGRRILAKVYPGYQVTDLVVRESEWLPGAYIYAVLARVRETEDRKGGGGPRRGHMCPSD